MRIALFKNSDYVVEGFRNLEKHQSNKNILVQKEFQKLQVLVLYHSSKNELGCRSRDGRMRVSRH